MNRLRSWIFPLSLALILSGLSAWLGRMSEVVIEEVKLSPDEPQYLMHTIEGRRYAVSGSLKEILSAHSAWQLPDRKNVYFRQPDLRLFDEGQVQYAIKSENAHYAINSKKVFFENNVMLNKAADFARPAAAIRTAHLEVDTVSQIAQTQDPVTYRYGDSHGTANGMIYDNKNGLLNLPSRVRALIYDPKQLP
ncbi:MAG: LPS export ABC transporter periplasmic protein LptC [Alysiella sp.]|uniref:LPS export ABC transporter periplasmic protein LptC n=1 Tax=Alysiella sp. TaxID=1872483 RepID=UPI0026DC2231|nr:LPS export ABC transporter periplasmic protein LptC [Alysiella sp.]MDO4434164.1 LPS export ABC transporter periplasmic protein LptC [Alysiella sp.]